MQIALRSLSIIDDLTGLYNRRGFLRLAEHHLQIAGMKNRKMVLFFVDIDFLKKINDTYGHREGDQVLITTAKILRETFRAADVVARLGGDEFTILMINAGENGVEICQRRLKERLKKLNAQKTVKYDLSFSMGWALYQPKGEMQTVEQLISVADQHLYDNKHKS